jgi:glycosyltransferase involved in cell wall biosynthesis
LARLSVGVPRDLLSLQPTSGHGKVWNRVLTLLADEVRISPLGRPGGMLRPRRRRSLDVVLADGHADLPSEARDHPLAVQVHEAAWLRPELRDVLDPRFARHVASRTACSVRAAARIITPSESARADLIEGYGLGPDLVVAAHHGVDPAFRPEAGAFRSEIVEGDAPYILYAAMIHPRKNLDVVRKAVDALARAGYPHRLVIAGGPATDRPDSSDLEARASAELAHAPGRVTRVSNAPENELATLMAGADAFCLPSLYEGFGLTVLEAMACATVPVVSNRGALPEVVERAGIIVEPQAEPVHEALRTLIDDPAKRDRLANAAARRARSFTWEATAEAWLRAVRQAASRRRSG